MRSVVKLWPLFIIGTVVAYWNLNIVRAQLDEAGFTAFLFQEVIAKQAFWERWYHIGIAVSIIAFVLDMCLPDEKPKETKLEGL